MISPLLTSGAFTVSIIIWPFNIFFLLYSYLKSFKFLKDRLLIIQSSISPLDFKHVSMKFTHFQEENCSAISEYVRICKNVLGNLFKTQSQVPIHILSSYQPFSSSCIFSFIQQTLTGTYYVPSIHYVLTGYRIKISNLS